MSTILEIRENLINAEREYKSANSMLDDNGNMLIAAKDKLKICRRVNIHKRALIIVKKLCFVVGRV